MRTVFLGKLALYWCHSCNLPVLGKKCSICSSQTAKVKHTPPGDVRPAFGPDLKPIRKLIDEQFGDGCGEHLIPGRNIVLFNRIPHVDRMEEVIVSGVVVGNYRYDIGTGYSFILKPRGALRISSHLAKHRVVVDNEAAVFIKRGTSVLAPGIIDADPDIEVEDEVVVMTEDGEVIGSGSARVTGTEMKESNYGLGVRLRRKWEPIELPENYDKPGTWEGAVNASMNTLLNHEKEAVEFINWVVEKHSSFPVLVSLSGGKDSLAVLLLVLEAGQHPELLFLNTGLEFPETIENVKVTAKNYGLPLVIAEAGNAFWDSLQRFGPPSKDYRWCCKVCKLGPTTRTIMERYPDGVLSFIGQRSYESMQRAKKPRVWENPWVPGQVGASPIQNWTALHIWLYIFWKKAEYNPLYELGLSRIGCWLCPASDQADYLDVVDVHPDGERWENYLQKYADNKGFTREWVDYGLWKWKQTPGFVKDIMKNKGIRFRKSVEDISLQGKSQVPGSEKDNEKDGDGPVNEPLRFIPGETYSTCEDEHMADGIFSHTLAIERDSAMLNILGETMLDTETGVCTIGKSLTLTKEGSMSVRGNDPSDAKKKLLMARDIVFRAEECVGCGICMGRCPTGALFINEENVIDILPTKCTHCLSCLGKCPVTDFRGDREFEV